MWNEKSIYYEYIFNIVFDVRVIEPKENVGT